MQTQTLRIQCRPHFLFSYDPWLKLDALLQRAMLLEQYGPDYYALPTLHQDTQEKDLIFPTLPLERRERNGIWYYACSWCNADAHALAYDKSAWVRQYPDKDASEYLDSSKRNLIKNWQGPDKDYNVPVHGLIADQFTWYAVGDKEEIERLLSYYNAIGKKSAYDFGHLCQYEDGRTWIVESWPHDWSEVDGEGLLTRGLPYSGASFPLDMKRYAVRPPYHCLANYAFLMMPNERHRA